MYYFRLVYFNPSKEKFIIIFTFLPKVKDRYKSYYILHIYYIC